MRMSDWSSGVCSSDLEVLGGAGDADGDVEFGRDDLAGLADLIVVGRVTRIDRGAPGAHPGAELVGERVVQCVELVGRPERPSARDEDPGAGAVRPLAPGTCGTADARPARLGRTAPHPDAVGAALPPPPSHTRAA